MTRNIIKENIWCGETLVESQVWRRTFEDTDKALEEIRSYVRDDIEETVSNYEETPVTLVAGLQMSVCFDTEHASYGLEIWEIEV